MKDALELEAAPNSEEITWRGPKPIAENLSFISLTLALPQKGILPSGSGSWASDLPNSLSNKPHCCQSNDCHAITLKQYIYVKDHLVNIIN